MVLEIFQKELADSKNIECKYKCNQSSTDLEDALEHFQKCPEKVTEVRFAFFSMTASSLVLGQNCTEIDRLLFY